MPASSHSVVPMPDANEALFLEGLHNTLGMTPGGGTMRDKGIGLQINRDPETLKIVEVIVCFADKVTAPDKAEALMRVADGEGVEVVLPSSYTPNFDGFGEF